MGYSKIVLKGQQKCDYLYVQNLPVNAEDFGYVNAEPTAWGTSTVLFSKFDGNLNAGDSELVGRLEGYELRRKKGTDAYTEYVATLTSEYESQHVIDYMVASNSSYTYYLYPCAKTSGSGITLSPTISKQVTPEWNYWTLMVVDETDEENVFYLSKMFKFELNVEPEDMNNNTDITIAKNFTPYPTIQYSPSNFWTGALTSLCGFISCNNIEYIEAPDIINELKTLTTDTRRKFLKDTDGNVWEIQITAPINISTDYNTIRHVKSVRIAWAEIGSVKGISVINNPKMSVKSWVLTDNGYAAPYVDYEWNNNEIWDNRKIWTNNHKVLDVDISNAGRELYSKEDDV